MHARKAARTRVLPLVAIAALGLLAAPSLAVAATAHQRYAITITATTERWEQSRLPDGTVTGTWVHTSRWTAKGTTVVRRRGARVSFVARIGGLLRTHDGIGRSLIRIVNCEAWADTKDIAPSRSAFRGDLRYLRFRRRLASGKSVDAVSLLFVRRAPLLEPKLTEFWSATACSPERIDSERTRLAVPPSWVLRRPLARHRALPAFRFGKAFTWKKVHPDQMPITVDVPGAWQQTDTHWTITFRPVRKR
jgi:hypothetical protein